MLKGFRVLIISTFVLLIGLAVFAQDSGKGSGSGDVTYDKRYIPLSVIKRLSYENFRDIKLIYSSLVNFGGGEAEFDKLVEEYADSSALYFSNKVVESANMFTKNEKNILNTAIKLAQVYKVDAEKLHADVAKMKIKAGIKMSLKGVNIHGAIDKVFEDAAHSLNRANDYEIRKRPIDAIIYYRQAKRNYFMAYDIVNGQFVAMASKATNKADKDYLLKLAESYKLPEKYKKDIIDNTNRIYEAKEKQK
jgi:hypothetical protein